MRRIIQFCNNYSKYLKKKERKRGDGNIKIMKRQKELKEKRDSTAINVRLGDSDRHSTKNNLKC